MRNLAALAALTFVALAPAAFAQDVPASTVTLTLGALAGTVDDDGRAAVPYAGNATVPFTVTIGCGLIATTTAANQGQDSDHVHVTIVDPSAWVVPRTVEAHLEPADIAQECATAQAVTRTGTLPLQVTAAAPGVVPQNVTVAVQFGGSDAEHTFAPTPLAFSVQFHADYSVVPDAQFPLEVKGGEAQFKVAITQRSNTRSMVMVEEVRASAGSFGGIGSVVYDPPETKEFTATFKAPTACWTEAQASFKTYAHFLLLDSQAGEYKLPQEHTYTFRNGDSCEPGTTGNGTQEAPVGIWTLAPALLGAALLARRRRAA
jgi:MYXO-CTERM domain-containing protein